MATRQYIGARYVPKFYDYNGSPNWRPGVEYENLTIVTRNGNSYTSKKPVPSDIGEPENNPEYWVSTGLYNEQVEAYRQLTMALSSRLDDFTADGAIGTNNLADGAVTEDKIANDSVTEDKIDNSLLKNIINVYVKPEEYGAVGDGVTDDTSAIQSALDGGNKIIVFGNGKIYVVNGTLNVEKNTFVDLNNATIISNDRHTFYNFKPSDIFTLYNGNGNITIANGTIKGGSCSFIHGKNITIDNVNFIDCNNDHMIEICACYNVKINRCFLNGMVQDTRYLEYVNIDPCYRTNFPWMTNDTNYDHTPNKYITVNNCVFKRNSSGDYIGGMDAIGVHSPGEGAEVLPDNHSYITITENIIEDFSNFGIRANCMDNVNISDNTILHKGMFIELGRWSQNKNVKISNNSLIDTALNSPSWFYEICDQGAANLSIYGNAYSRNNTPPVRSSKIKLTSLVSASNLSFTKLDGEYLCGANETGDLTTNIPVTSVDELIVISGGIAPGTWKTDTIKSFPIRKFVIGESYPFIYYLDGALNVGTVTIKDDYTITVSGTPLRDVIGKCINELNK